MLVTRNVEVETDQFEVGDVIEFELKNGEKVKAMAAHKVDAGMIFIYIDLLPEYHPMNKTDKNAGGWEKCGLRKWLNEKYLQQFPDDLRARMIPTDTGDLLRIPTEKEIFGNNRIADEDEDESVRRFEIMKEPRNRIAMWKDGTTDLYWLQNTVSASDFASVHGSGDASGTGASYSWVGVRPLFLLSSDPTADRR